MQRDIVVERILRSDPDLAQVLPRLLAQCEHAKWVQRNGPLLRDGISWSNDGQPQPEWNFASET